MRRWKFFTLIGEYQVPSIEPLVLFDKVTRSLSCSPLDWQNLVISHLIVLLLIAFHQHGRFSCCHATYPMNGRRQEGYYMST